MENNFFHKYPYENFHELNLDWILSKINEFDATLKEWSELAEKLGLALDDIATMKNAIAAIEDNISDLPEIRNAIEANTSNIALLSDKVDVISVQLDGVYQYIDDKYLELDAKLFESQTLLMVKMNQMKLQLQQEIDELKQIVRDIDTSVYNSWIGRKVTNQQNTDFAFNHLADECLTAEEYSSLGLDASDYADFDLTSRDYQEFGKKKLHFRWVYAPAYGFRQELSNVLTSIINFVKNTLSASEYAALDMTADEYAALDLTSMDYFSYNPNIDTDYVTETQLANALDGAIFHDADLGSGLTAGEYAKLMINSI